VDKSHLYFGDNLDVLREYVPTASVDLVYLDPPFNSNRAYNVIFARSDRVADANQAQIQAFDDTWRWSPVTEEQYHQMIAGAVPSRVADVVRALHALLGENDALAYLVNMAPRLVELHRVLKRTGSLYLHCDPTMSHYLKVLLDAIFGAENFVNEITWQRTSSKGDANRKFGAIHDVILGYAKTSAYTFAPVFADKDDTYTGRFTLDDQDDRGPYRLAPLDSPNPRPNLTYAYRGFQPPAKGWRVSRDVMEQLDADGRLAFPKTFTGRIARKHYLAEQAGRKLGDVWVDIPPLQAASAERLGYPTQKPLALLERILRASSREGDVVLDPFCGCGTTVDAAQKLGRRWVGIDITYIAVDLIRKRLQHTYGESIAATYEVTGIPRDLASARSLFTRSPFEFERWAVSLVHGTPNQKQVGDRGIDGVVRFYTDSTGATGRVLVSVKGGKSLGPQYVRDLVGTVQTERAEMGSLLTLTEPTRGIHDAVAHAGSYQWPVTGTSFPRAQVLTVEDLLGGRKLQAPPALVLPYIPAARHKVSFDQLILL